MDSFSVVIPLYNKENYIRRAIDSILSQTVQNFEILVVDDCSTDDGVEIVRSYQDQDARIRLIRQETNRGVSAARNRGIAEAKFEWVAFLDADDEWKPDFLETIAVLQEKYPGCGAYATAYEYHFEDSNKVTFPSVKGLPQGWMGIIEDYFALAVSGSPIWTGAVTASRKALNEIGEFPEGISHGEDLYVWALIALNYSIAYENVSHAVYYQNIPNQLTKSISDFNGEALKMLIAQYEEKKIPGKIQDSFLDYLFRRTIIGARCLILFEYNGKDARKLLKLNPKEGLEFSERRQFLWLYLWSYIPHLFERFVGIKELIKDFARAHKRKNGELDQR